MGQLTEDRVKEALATVQDPEIAMDIIELGLVYDLELDPEDNVKVEMSLTTPGCPLGDTITTSVENALHRIGAKNVEVQLVWSPPWTPDMMSDEAKMRLGWGIR